RIWIRSRWPNSLRFCGGLQPGSLDLGFLQISNLRPQLLNLAFQPSLFVARLICAAHRLLLVLRKLVVGVYRGLYIGIVRVHNGNDSGTELIGAIGEGRMAECARPHDRSVAGRKIVSPPPQ